MRNQDNMTPLVSVVTPCFNSIKFIEDTIHSVLEQTYSPIEYIIMDGNSTDGTVEFARRYIPRLTLISEPDQGQSDAINKGWRRAKGEILAWLNADDYYMLGTVQAAVNYLEQHPEAGWVYGSFRALDADNKPKPFRYPIGPWSYEKLLNHMNYIVQPTVFLRRRIVEEFGYLREDLHYAMDHEYWLRIGRKYPGHFVPEISVAFRWYHETKSSSGGIPRMNEIDDIVRSYGRVNLPPRYRPEWVRVYLADLWGQVRRGQLNLARSDLREILRYPRALPPTIAKTLMFSVMPPGLESKLRKLLIRGPSSE